MTSPKSVCEGGLLKRLWRKSVSELSNKSSADNTFYGGRLISV